MGEPSSIIYVVEGFATGATVHEATRAYVVIAFDAGNLESSTLRLLREYPEAQIIIAADNDAWTDGNPGLTQAQEAAKTCGAQVLTPRFQRKASKPTDFNDLLQLEGLLMVRDQLTALPETTVETWPAPIPLQDHVPPELPVGIFPPWLDQMIEAVSQCTETPRELPMTLGLAVLATACQRTLEIEPEPGYVEPMNIWGISAMESGNRKTAVLNYMTAPLLDYERDQSQLLQPEKERIESERKTCELRIQHLRKQGAQGSFEDIEKVKREIADLEENLPKIPLLPQLWAQDVTPEKLGQLMADHDEGMALISDEGGLFETIAGRYSGGIPNLDLMLQAHAGAPVRVDRTGRESISMRHPVLTLGLSPQPDILRGLNQKPGFRGRGFIARFLYTLPISRLGYRSLEAHPVPSNVRESYASAVRKLLASKPPQMTSNDGQRFRLRMSPEAHREWKDFQRIVERDLRVGGRFGHIQDWGAKLPGAAARIAGLLHCAAHWDEQPWAIPVARNTMESTLLVMAIFAEHTLLAFEVIAANPDLEKAKKIWHWILRNRKPSFTGRECHQALKGTFVRKADLVPGLELLKERFFIGPGPSPHLGPGRPSDTYLVNPQFTKEWTT